MKSRKAFSLIEATVVVAIVMVILVISVPKYVDIIHEARATQCESTRKILEQAEARYRLEHSGMPSSSLDDLRSSNYIERVPKCTSDGYYVWASTSDPVMGCSVHYWPFDMPASSMFSSKLDSMAGLKAVMGTWSAAGGTLQSVKFTEARIVFGDTNWRDYDLTVNATIMSGKGYGVYFRADDKSAISGYCFQFDPGLGGFAVRKVVNGEESAPIAFSKFPKDFPVYNAPHQISIITIGSRQVITVDSVRVLSFTDTSFASGGAGLRSWDKTVVNFDSVGVSGI